MNKQLQDIYLNIEHFQKKNSFDSVISNQDSGHSTSSSEYSDYAHLEHKTFDIKLLPDTVVCAGLMALGQLQNFDALNLNDYCLWGLPDLTGLNQNQGLNPLLLSITNSIPANNVNVIKSASDRLYKPVPILNDVNNVLNSINKASVSSSMSLTQSNSAQQFEAKSVYSQADMGENSQSSHKSSYIKAVFHITRVNKKTKRSKRINKHRHVISHWEHVGAQYYARGMCKKWYFSKGQRKKNAYKWKHTDRSHYATGLCKLCYLKNYHKTHDRKKKLDD